MDMGDNVKYDSKCTIDLIGKYGDFHIVGVGWKEADTGEWKIYSL